MKWERAGKYAIRSGDWIISKCMVDGIPQYGLWYQGKNKGYYDDAETAKSLAKTPNERVTA